MIGGRVVAAGAMLAGLLPAPPEPTSETLLTIPQHDRLRPRVSSPSASISDDGHLIAFASYGRLTADDEDSVSDIYLLDRTSESVSLVSVPAEGLANTAAFFNPRLSRNGRHVVYESEPDVRGVSDVLLRDLHTRTVRVVSRRQPSMPSDGRSSNADLSDDGRMVVFESCATNLVEETDANGALPDVYLWDGGTGALRRISVDARGRHPATGGSMGPVISGNGQFVAFSSTALPASADGTRRSGQPGHPAQIYVRDLQHDTIAPIRGPSAAPNNWSASAAISADGRFIAFVSAATNLASGDRNRVADVFLFDRTTARIALVSRSIGGGAGNGPSSSPSISADGRFVAFQSEASDLVCARRCRDGAEDINLLPDVFLFDRTTSSMRWISSTGAGGWMEESVAPAVSSAGDVVAFTSRHPMDGRDVAHDFDLFVKILKR